MRSPAVRPLTPAEHRERASGQFWGVQGHPRTTPTAPRPRAGSAMVTDTGVFWRYRAGTARSSRQRHPLLMRAAEALAPRSTRPRAQKVTPDAAGHPRGAAHDH